jgi:hypothetical protein
MMIVIVFFLFALTLLFVKVLGYVWLGGRDLDARKEVVSSLHNGIDLKI